MSHWLRFESDAGGANKAGYLPIGTSTRGSAAKAAVGAYGSCRALVSRLLLALAETAREERESGERRSAAAAAAAATADDA